jgi:hypothetical protein
MKRERIKAHQNEWLFVYFLSNIPARYPCHLLEQYKDPTSDKWHTIFCSDDFTVPQKNASMRADFGSSFYRKYFPTLCCLDSENVK